MISSISLSKQLPWYFSLAGKLQLHKIIPVSFLYRFKSLFDFVFGAKTKEQKQFLEEINKNPDLRFTTWAIDCIVKWKRNSNNFKPIHIHGTDDLIFPIKKVKPDYAIPGGHFMIFTEAKIVSEKIAEILNK